MGRDLPGYGFGRGPWGASFLPVAQAHGRLFRHRNAGLRGDGPTLLSQREVAHQWPHEPSGDTTALLVGEGPGSLMPYLLLCAGVAALALLWTLRLTRSPFGRGLKVVRDDEYVAQALGKYVFSLKARALATGSAMAGVCGALWAHYIQYISPNISPNDFTLNGTILVLLCVVLGGKGTTWAPLLGTLMIISLSGVAEVSAPSIGSSDASSRPSRGWSTA